MDSSSFSIFSIPSFLLKYMVLFFNNMLFVYEFLLISIKVFAAILLVIALNISYASDLGEMVERLSMPWLT